MGDSTSFGTQLSVVLVSDIMPLPLPLVALLPNIHSWQFGGSLMNFLRSNSMFPVILQKSALKKYSVNSPEIPAKVLMAFI